MDHGEYKRIVPGADTALLLIHGISGTPRHFDFLLERAPEDISVWSLLLPGHGGSTKDFARACMSAWRAHVDAAVSELSQNHTRILVAGHSMGTLLALENAIEKPGRIDGLFLLAVPLCMMLSPRATVNSIGAAFGSPERDTPALRAAREGCSVELSRDPLDYPGWLPRYLELFALAKTVRRLLPGLKTPCTAYQSRRDELVSPRSVKYMENVQVHILEHSMHYYYPEKDKAYLQNEFEKFMKKEEA